MSSVADELITKFTLKDDYTAGVAKASRATQGFGRATKQAQADVGNGKGSGLMGAFSTLKGGVNEVTVAIAAATASIAAVAGVGAGLIDFGAKAIDAFAGYDRIERTFMGIYGSAKAAKQMMSYLNAEAQKGEFTFKDLADAASRVVMTGLKFDDYKQFIELVGMKAGGGAEGLREAADILTRISSGEGGEAWRRLKEMGFGNQLAKLGIVFDKSGEFKGNVTQALTALKGLGTSGGGIMKAMEGSALAGMANVREAFTRGLAAIGEGIWGNVKGGIQSLADAINVAIDSGAIKDTFSGIVNLFTADAGEISLTKVIASVLAGVQTAAAFVKNVWDFIKALFDSPVVKFLLKTVMHVGVGSGPTAAWNGMDLGKMYDGLYAQNVARMESYEKKHKNDKLAEPDNPNAATTPLQQIAENTKATAQHTKAQADMSRHAFGGGDLGRLGVTPLEMRGRGAPRGNPAISVNVAGGIGKAIEDIVSATVMQTVTQMKRQGFKF